MTEREEIIKALSEIIKPEFIDEWLNTPNKAFDGMAPEELITNGDTERLWRTIYWLGSGEPSS